MFELSCLRKLLVELLNLIDDFFNILTVQHFHIIQNGAHLLEVLLSRNQQSILKLHFYFKQLGLKLLDCLVKLFFQV